METPRSVASVHSLQGSARRTVCAGDANWTPRCDLAYLLYYGIASGVVREGSSGVYQGGYDGSTGWYWGGRGCWWYGGKFPCCSILPSPGFLRLYGSFCWTGELCLVYRCLAGRVRGRLGGGITRCVCLFYLFCLRLRSRANVLVEARPGMEHKKG